MRRTTLSQWNVLVSFQICSYKNFSSLANFCDLMKRPDPRERRCVTVSRQRPTDPGNLKQKHQNTINTIFPVLPRKRKVKGRRTFENRICITLIHETPGMKPLVITFESPDNFSGPESYFMCAMFKLKIQILLVSKVEQ